MKRHIKLLASMIWYCGQVPWRVVRSWLPGASPRHVVLYYHAVPAQDARAFERQMAAIANDRSAVPLVFAGAGKTARIYNSVTFDDALESVRNNAVPAMRKHAVPSTIFAPVDNLGECPRWDIEPDHPDAAERVMTAESLVALQDDLVAIESHTCTHPRLSTLTDQELNHELVESRKKLSAILGREITLLAFPYGDADARVVAACREAGYTRVYSIRPRVERIGGGRFVVGRVSVNSSDGPLVFFLKRKGAYSWIPAASALKRAIRKAIGS